MILGIDPGSSSGAFVILNKDKEILLISKFKSENEAVHDIKPFVPELLGGVLEHVHSMPKQGISSAFTFGANFGFWRGLLMALEIPYILVTPQKWQASMFDSQKKGENKQISLNLGQRLYPHIKLGKTDHGKTDAILMALYGLKIAQF